MSAFIITVAAAAARLGTNSGVINRWIQEGYIPTVSSDDGVKIPLEQFEQICSELKQWAAENKETQRVTVKELEEFWKSRKTPQQ